VIDARWTKLFLAWTLATPENALDDYSPVRRRPRRGSAPREPYLLGTLHRLGRRRASHPVDQVRFDETRRQFVQRASIESVLGTL